MHFSSKIIFNGFILYAFNICLATLCVIFRVTCDIMCYINVVGLMCADPEDTPVKYRVRASPCYVVSIASSVFFTE